MNKLKLKDTVGNFEGNFRHLLGNVESHLKRTSGEPHVEDLINKERKLWTEEMKKKYGDALCGQTRSYCILAILNSPSGTNTFDDFPDEDGRVFLENLADRILQSLKKP